MPAYMIADINIINPARYEEYRMAMRAAVEKHGGRYLVRASQVKILEGTWNPPRVVVIEFPSMAQAEEFYRSAEFMSTRALRQNAAMVNMILASGD